MASNDALRGDIEICSVSPFGAGCDSDKCREAVAMYSTQEVVLFGVVRLRITGRTDEPG
jgi:hypothetical protein